MKIAFMFPGQGSQVVGMGKDFYEKYQDAKEVYDNASDILNIDMKKLCFESSQEELNKTSNTQIAIATTSLAILKVIKNKNIKADICVGLSLGEYVALIEAGYISFEDGLKLLKKRGYYMEHEIPNDNYLMAAIIGLDSKIIEEVCNTLLQENLFVVPANYNYSEQTVISGAEDAVKKAIELLKEKGAKRAIPLKTSGPFHTKKLEKAKELYSGELEKVDINNNNISCEVIKNIDGTLYTKEDNIKDILSNHITNSVRFDKTIELMKNKGIDTFIEIGPGKAISSFVKKELKDAKIKCYSISTIEDLENVVNSLKED